MTSNVNSKGIVLVVDDSADSLEMLNEALVSEGYTIFVAMDGQQAITIAERMRPDVIIMDAIMPVMDGFKACRELKKNRELEDIPVIFMTGLSDTEDVLNGLNAGGVDYINKPVNLDELIARIQVHLKNARLTKSAQSALDEISQKSLACDINGQLIWCTSSARQFFKQFFPRMEWNDSPISAQLKNWLSQGPAKNDTLTIKGSEKHCRVRYLGSTGSGEYLLKFTDIDDADIRAAIREHCKLTDRETEVLFWIAQGKSNSEIGQILSTSPRTVNKHLEQIYKKLNVGNRTSAAAVYLQFANAG